MRAKIIFLISGTALAGWLAFGDDQKKELPDWVLRIMKAELPETEILRGYREGRHHENRYEVKARTKDGRGMTVDLVEEAGIVDIDEEIKKEQVPAAVVRCLNKVYPNAEFKKGEKHTDIRVNYKLNIVSEGRKREVTISPRGKILEIEKED